MPAYYNENDPFAAQWLPVEPGTFPLAHGTTSRVGRLRAYGNAINAKAATVFVEALMDHMGYGEL